jgi:hypothetical protein
MALVDKVVAKVVTVDTRTQTQKLMDAANNGLVDVSITRGAGRASKERYLSLTFGDAEGCKIPLGEGDIKMSEVRRLVEAVNAVLVANLDALPSVAELEASEAGAAFDAGSTTEGEAAPTEDAETTPDAEASTEEVAPTPKKRR